MILLVTVTLLVIFLERLVHQVLVIVVKTGAQKYVLIFVMEPVMHGLDVVVLNPTE